MRVTGNDEGACFIEVHVVGAERHGNGVFMREHIGGRVAGVDEDLAGGRRSNGELFAGGRKRHAVGEGDEEGGKFMLEDGRVRRGLGVEGNMGNLAQRQGKERFDKREDVPQASGESTSH